MLKSVLTQGQFHLNQGTFINLNAVSVENNVSILKCKKLKKPTLTSLMFFSFQEAIAQALIGHPTIQAVMEAAENIQPDT